MRVETCAAGERSRRRPAAAPRQMGGCDTVFNHFYIRSHTVPHHFYNILFNRAATAAACAGRALRGRRAQPARHPSRHPVAGGGGLRALPVAVSRGVLPWSGPPSLCPLSTGADSVGVIATAGGARPRSGPRSGSSFRPCHGSMVKTNGPAGAAAGI